jgi:putative ABC transport system permease protein
LIGLLLQSYAELIETIDSMMASIVGSLRGLLGLAFVVAGFGLVDTLSMDVLEQTRELGMLRVVAMTRSQVRRVIFAQAAMMGMIGLIPGAASGVCIAYLTNLSLMPVLGHPVVFHLYPGMPIGILGAASVIILLAAWIPAERAARLEPAKAMRFE